MRASGNDGGSSGPCPGGRQGETGSESVRGPSDPGTGTGRLGRSKSRGKGDPETGRAPETDRKTLQAGESYLKKDMEFHELLARISRNSVMPRLVPIIQEGVSLFIEVTELSLAEETLRTHRKIVEAIQDRGSTEGQGGYEGTSPPESGKNTGKDPGE